MVLQVVFVHPLRNRSSPFRHSESLNGSSAAAAAALHVVGSGDVPEVITSVVRLEDSTIQNPSVQTPQRQ